MADNTTPKRKLGVTELACYGIGNCIGSGIFVSMGTAIGFTGHSVTLALFVACVVVLFAYAYKTLMAGMFAFPGGNYSQSALLQPPLLVGITAVTSVFYGLAYAMYGISIVEYASTVFPGIVKYEKPIAILIITVFFLSTLLGGKFMAKLNLVMVAVLIVSLMVYLIVGLPQVDYGTALPTGDNYFSNGGIGFIMAVATLSFACQGATMPVAMTADAENPKKNMPKAILLASAVVTVIYCFIGIVTAGILPIEQVANQNLGVVAKEIFPYGVFVIFILGGACFSIATSLFGAIASRPHPMLAMVEDGWLPAFFGKKMKNGYPWVIMLILYLVTIVPVYIDMGLQELISLMTIPNMLINLANNILMFRLVKKYPTAWKTGFFGKLPKWAFNMTIVLSVICTFIISVSLLVSLKPGEQYMVILAVAAMFGYSYYRIKSGKVNLKDIENAKAEAEKIAEASL